MRQSSRLRSVHASLLLVISACGGGEPEPTSEPEPAASSGDEQAAPRRSLEVSGLMGTIPESKIRGVLEPKLPKFQRCFMEGMDAVEFLGGHFKFYFRVDHEGSVEWVDPRGSSVGHRATEQCLLEEAARTRFPSPQGGDAAEFVWGFELDPVGGVRTPTEWDANRVESTAAASADSLAACELDGHRYVVTAYIAKDGTVMGVGAAADSHDAAARIDCLVQAVSGWEFPKPGSYPAKVSFELP